MTVTAVVGLQWGDEAKGKIVNLLTDAHDIVVRYGGGNNAGHTVQFQGQTYKLSLLPTGILRSHVTSVIGNGVVVNPQHLLKEMQGLLDRGLAVGHNLLVSDRAHVIFPHHMVEEGLLEKSRRENAIGTTMRGIGTCYRDKASRTLAFRMGDLYKRESFRTRLDEVVAFKNTMFQAFDPGCPPLDAAQIFADYVGYADRLKPHVTDTAAYLHRALRAGKKILFEGAQGSLLDLDHGSFPYVTSSNSSGAGISSGTGLSARCITNAIGVAKAYTTRVGGGPFPTELDNEIGQHIRDVGREYGTVTGRPRRCGWFDAVATGYGARISGVDCLAVMLLDVLAQLDELKICEAYEIHGERTTDFPAHIEDLAVVKPVYRTLPGWKKDICGVTKLADLPANARRYLDTIAEIIDRPIQIVSVGPDRDQTILD